MIKLFFPSLIFICLSLSGQKTFKTNSDVTYNRDSVAFVQKCVAFIKGVKSQQVSDTNFILSDKPFSFQSFNCITYLLTDTATYTKEELAFIKDKKFPSLTKWTKESFENIKLVSNDSINAIFKESSKQWPYFNKHIGRDFNTFSVPIFLRDDTYCLFYSDFHCGGLCGGGKLTLYKKQNNKWTAVKSYCNWIS